MKMGRAYFVALWIVLFLAIGILIALTFPPRRRGAAAASLAQMNSGAEIVRGLRLPYMEFVDDHRDLMTDTEITEIVRRECGILCLYSLLRRMDIEVEYEELEEVFELTDKGVSVLSICKASERFGVKLWSYKADLSFLREGVTEPAILHLTRNNNEGHFMVFLGFKREEGSYRMLDPSGIVVGGGLQEWSEERLKEMWDGIVITPIIGSGSRKMI